MGREGSSITGDEGSIASHHHSDSGAASIRYSNDNVGARMSNVLTSIHHVTKDIRDLSSILQNTQGRGIPPIPFKEWREASAKVELNVGGSIFRVSWELMLRVPDCRLARVAVCSTEEELNNCGATFDSTRQQVCFSQRTRNFLDILDFYRGGRLHMSSNCCPVEYVEELSYWGLSENNLQPCCFKRWIESREELDWEEEGEEKSEGDSEECSSWVWDLFEHPQSSLGARLMGLMSVACILLSTIVLTLDTLPYFASHKNKIGGEFAPFVVIEICYMAYFTIEFLARLISCPSKKDFCKNLMNWIDLLAILPYFVTFGLNVHGITVDAVGIEGDHAGAKGLLPSKNIDCSSYR